MILACNIVEGGLIPLTLLGYETFDERRSRTVNLLDVATPTAALRNLEKDYRAAVKKILDQDPADGSL